MAYIIYTTDNKVYRIAETDAQKTAVHGIENYNAVSISDSDFAKIKRNELSVGDYDSANSQHSTTAIDITGSLDGDGNAVGTIYDENSLTSYLKNVKQQLKSFVDENNSSSHILFTTCNNYLDYLNHFYPDMHDFTATPIYSWEKYCEDNSIAYLHPLQIP